VSETQHSSVFNQDFFETHVNDVKTNHGGFVTHDYFVKLVGGEKEF